MTSVFPTSLDAFVNPSGNDLLENANDALDHASQHANANDALAALQAKVGTDGSAVTTSLDYLVKNPSSADPGHTHSASSITGILPVANGGTGTSTEFTPGSLIFAGADGVYSQDNANLFWDDANNRLGIGTATPATDLHVSGAGARAIRIESTDNTSAALELIRPGASSNDYRLINDAGVFKLQADPNAAWGTLCLAANADGGVGLGTTSTTGTRAKILPQTTSTVGLQIQGLASQTADLLQTLNSSNEVLVSLSETATRAGLLKLANNYAGATWNFSVDNAGTLNITRPNNFFKLNYGNPVSLSFGNSIGGWDGVISTTGDLILQCASASKSVIVKGVTSQSENVFEAQDSSGTVGARITSALAFSDTGGQGSSEKFGAGASVSSTNATALGNSATVTATGGTAIGEGASCGGATAIAIGRGSSVSSGASGAVAIGGSATGSNAIVVGNSATASASSVAVGTSSSAGSTSVAIGASANAGSGTGVAVGASANAAAEAVSLGSATDAGSIGCVAIGYLASRNGNTGVILLGRRPTANGNNRFIAGSSLIAMNDVFFGKGDVNATPTAYTINGTGGSGTDVAGADLRLAGGKGTGNAAGGSVIIQTSTAGASGTTLQSLTARLTVDNAGLFTVWDGGSIAVGTTTGTKIGTATNQKIGFFNATPVVQPANTTDLRTALINLGLYASGGATPLDLNAGVFSGFRANAVDDANTSITIGSGDTGKAIRTTSGSAVSVTLSATAAVGTSISLQQGGAGQVTFAADSGGTLVNRQSHTKTAAQYAMVTLYVDENSGGSAANWVLAGDTAA